ncbi:MAG: hypothetical protein ACRDY0_03060 [Acidimicrobiales bacterium]
MATVTAQPGFSLARLISPAVLLAGAGAYALAEGPGKATFYITPLSVGVIAALAGLLGTRRSLFPAGLGIAGWGTAVALVHYSVVPSGKEEPVYMIGIAAGILVTSYIAPRAQRAAWAHSAAVAAVGTAIGYYLSFQFSTLVEWHAWAIALGVWAAWELVISVVWPAASLRDREAAGPAKPVGGLLSAPR